MGRIFATLFAGLACTMVFAGTAGAQEATSFYDPFDSFDTARWSVGDHNLGRSYLDPTNVDTSGGNLRIKHPARSYEGGEVLTNALHGHGSYSARLKPAYAPGSITGFFLYKSPDFESEIDVEIYNDRSGRVMFTTYAGGRQTHTETAQLGFDPTAAYHQYAFDYAADSVTFYVDGRPVRTWDTGIPQTSMHLMVNSWFPAWLNGNRPKKTVYTQIDWIRFTAEAATP
jgi:endo-1,3-1,4-beta-glycanase ExoK